MKHNTKNMNIGKALNTMLSTILPSYPIIADQGANFPFSVYRRLGYQVKNTKDIYNYEETIIIEVNIAATTYAESIALAQRVKDQLEHTRGEFENLKINDISMTDAGEDWVNDAYIQTMRFNIDLDGK